MDARTMFSRGVETGLRLGRGTADRIVTVAGPRLGKVADKVVSKVRRPERPSTTTFTPSKQAEPHLPEQPGSMKPSPATVARNIGPPRPSAKPARQAKPKGGPGAKLPPPRPTAT
ncbi:MAG TPA: hypothetical protein VFI19_04085 [Nocardioides sp.]|jgi:hypothetical protein|nr:hypothetical protein [Nocardioides sp.]